jgi:aminoglycoside phosphotransferase (APT) family kinase protein
MTFFATGLDEIRRLVAKAFPHRKVAGYELLSGGYCNTNLKLTFESGQKPAVLRIYRRDPAACSRETELLRLIRTNVPVPEVFFAEPEHEVEPFAVLEYVEGVTFSQLKKTRDVEAIQQVATSAGKTLASIGHYRFSRPGILSVDKQTGELEVADEYIKGREPIPRLNDTFLASPKLQQRTGQELTARLHEFMWSRASRLSQLDEETDRIQCLVHSDFGGGNILVRQVEGKWGVVSLLDWEFAFSGSPLIDVGHFLRFERIAEPLREPYFSRAFVEHGGRLPDDWREVVKVLDLTALCEMLTRDDLPPHATSELLMLINATLEGRDPS